MLRTVSLASVRSSKHKILPFLVVLLFTLWQQNGLLCCFCCQDRLKVYIQYDINSLVRQLKRGNSMQQTLWGDELPQHTRKPASLRTTTTTVFHTASDCPIYGHNWQTIGMSGEKKCLACGVVGYCPGCTNDPPPTSQPFSCSRHTPLTESTVRP
jgi:hypothetical protein